MTSPIGRRTPRVDGPLKVSGVAQYASDFHFPGMLYAVPVEATIASGRLTTLDTGGAAKMPGVRAIFHRGNIGKIFRSAQGQGFEGISRRTPPAIRRRYHSLLRPIYRARCSRHIRKRQSRGRCGSRHLPNGKAERRDRPQSGRRAANSYDTTFAPDQPRTEQTRRCRKALSQAPRSSSTRPTLRRLKHIIRSSCRRTTAIWEDEKLTIYEESQGIFNMQGVLAQMFGLPKENVRVVTKFVGSGFRQQAMAMDTLLAGCRSRAAVGQAGQTRHQPQDDVPSRRSSPAHTTTRPPRCHRRWKALSLKQDYV